MKKNKFIAALLLSACISYSVAKASDHDDGETDRKARALNLTDMYLFKESSQIVGGSFAHLVFVMNSNPRSLPQTQYYFSTAARYEFKVTRVGTTNVAPVTGAEDITFRFKFSAPDAAKQQNITITMISGTDTKVITQTDTMEKIKTTSFALSAVPVNNAVTLNGQVLNIFAGLREDPFFFDVTAFVKFRATGTGFPAAIPTDFTTNYNVNSIVMRLPIAILQKNAETVFDTWAVISVPQAN